MAAKSKGQDKGVTECPVGTVLFREGEAGTKLYGIKSGRVCMTKRVFDTEVTIEDLGPGDFCGEIALVTEQPRPATATVIADASVIQIESNQFENMLRSNADIALRMMKKMSKRLTEAQFRIANFTLRTTKARLMHQIRAEVERSSGEAPIPDNMAEVLALEIGEIKALLGELVRDELINITPKGALAIVDKPAFDRYLRFLELHDHFEYRD